MGRTDTIQLSGAAIDRVRREKLLQLTQLAKAARITLTYLGQVRRGRPVGYRTAQRIAAALGVDVHEIVAADAESAGVGAAEVGGLAGRVGAVFENNDNEDEI